MDLSLPQAGGGLSSTLGSAATSARPSPNSTAPGTPHPEKVDQEEADFLPADLDDIHAATLAGSLNSVHLNSPGRVGHPPTPPAGVATPPLQSTQNKSRPPPPGRSNSSHDAKPVKPELEKKKSMFGKLFDRGNQSSTNLNSSAPPTPASERMERGDSAGTTTSHAPSIARRASGKSNKGDSNSRAPPSVHPDHLAPPPQTNRHRSESQETNRKRGESVGAKSDHGDKEKGNGMGAALNAFMQNKMSRKPSVTSRKSDDGQGESQYGGSQKSGKGSEKGSRAGGASSTSLLKKYGVCEKVVIGKGATAVVKLAHKWDRSTERLYAVKEFRKRRKNETEKEYVKKLTSEFCISSTLHHHNVVETVDLVQDEQQHWCEVMEYCPGGDLYAAIKKGEMGSPAISSYFKQILCGISYLHSMGVAHRDIKPENLLLDAHGHVKITDFGVSDVFRMCWEKTTHLSKGLCGSEPYIAPEQFEQKEYDARLVDVWACAVVLYCMHFQELPWRVAKLSDPSFGPYSQLYQSNPGHTAPPISNLVPRECRAIVRRMLDPDPKTRATTEEVLKDPWVMAIKVIPPRLGVPIDD